MKEMIRVLFVSDIHGSTPVFKKAVSAAAAYKAQVLIHGGDVLGKYIVPLLKRNEKTEFEFKGSKKVITSAEEMNEADAEITKIGAYPYLTTPDDWSELIANPDKMDKVFYDMAAERLKSWVDFAEEKLKPLDIKVIVNIGNDDFQSIGQIIEDSDYVIYPNDKVLELDDDHELLSLSNTNMTPWKCEGDLEEDELLGRLDKLTSKLQHPERSIFNLHCPPEGSKLDVAPLLDTELRPVYLPGGDPQMVHVGCKAVRTVIENVQPLAGLHGHIHEGKGIDKIGKTQVFNPGSEYTIGVLNSVLLNISFDKVESFLFLSA